MTAIQSVAILLTGYALSRVFLRAGAHLRFVGWLIARSGGRVSGVVLGLMLGAFVLSGFVPNALTVLAILPAVGGLRREATPETARRVGTVLVAGLIYGAGLGGMASLPGSPANLYLLLNLRLFEVPGREAIHVVSWMIFGLPTGLGILLLAWLVLRLVEAPTMRLRLQGGQHATDGGGLLAHGAAAAGLWFVSWGVVMILGLPEALGRPPSDRPGIAPLDLASIVLAVVYLAGLLAWPVKVDGSRERLLRTTDLWREIPLRGILLAAAVLVLLVAISRSGLVEWLAGSVPGWIPGGVGSLVATFVLIVVTIFATELLSNTTVSLAMFPVVFATAPLVGADPLTLMLAVSMASTCAFMTPIATPVNALALGGAENVDLARFARAGLVVNLVAAIVIAAVAHWYFPLALAPFR